MKLRTVIVSCVAVCMLFSVSTYAGVGLDFKGGLNLANLHGDGVSDDASMKLGAIFDYGVGIKIGDYFVIQPEFLFSMKGYKEEGTIDIGIGEPIDYEGAIKLSYLEIPILFKLNIPAGAVLPNFYVGPALAINVGSKAVVTIDDEEDEQDIKEDTKGVDFGLAMGGGLDIVAGPGRVIIEIRYTLGFMDIAEESEEGFEAMNGVLSFLVGYGIDLGE